MDTNVERQTGSLNRRLPDSPPEPVIGNVSIRGKDSWRSWIIFALGASLGAIDGVGGPAVFTSALACIIAAEGAMFVLKPFSIGRG